jgi:hypothetical protein
MKNNYNSLANKWLKLQNRYEDAVNRQDRAAIKKLAPLVEKARKAADAAYSNLVQAA